MRLDLGDDVRQFLVVEIFAMCIRIETLRHRSFDDGRIVRIGDDSPLRMCFVCFADHAEQRLATRLAVDGPGGVEYLVPAMFGIGLGEHHQFDIGGIAAEPAEVVGDVIDFVFRKRQAEADVGLGNRGTAAPQQIHREQL